MLMSNSFRNRAHLSNRTRSSNLSKDSLKGSEVHITYSKLPRKEIDFDDSVIDELDEEREILSREELEKMTKRDLIDLVEHLYEERIETEQRYRNKIKSMPNLYEERVLDLERRNLRLIQEYEERLGKLLEDHEREKRMSLASTSQEKLPPQMLPVEDFSSKKVKDLENILIEKEHELKIKDIKLRGLDSSYQTLIAEKQADWEIDFRNLRDRARNLEMETMVLQQQNESLNERNLELTGLLKQR